MRRLTCLSVLLVGFLAPLGASAAPTAAFPSGLYETRITKAGALNGVWRLVFLPNASGYTIYLGGRVSGFSVVGGRVMVSGSGKLAGNRLTFGPEQGPAACPQRGTYLWSATSTTLTLKLVADRCAGRKVVLSTHPLRKLA